MHKSQVSLASLRSTHRSCYSFCTTKTWSELGNELPTINYQVWRGISLYWCVLVFSLTTSHIQPPRFRSRPSPRTSHSLRS
ncbi:hypothetical protein LZ32DRAFT_33747 [Colletotrichum eremochloae]|nr:hypothetical protein LZ32DRAFT_33747 [Colletotrichum eremochloae]